VTCTSFRGARRRRASRAAGTSWSRRPGQGGGRHGGRNLERTPEVDGDRRSSSSALTLVARHCILNLLLDRICQQRGRDPFSNALHAGSDFRNESCSAGPRQVAGLVLLSLANSGTLSQAKA